MAERRKPRRRLVAKSLLAATLLASALAAFWFGLVPQRYSPLSPLSLSQGGQWFVDFRLAALRDDKALCAATLSGPHVAATPVDDNPLRNGCGWHNAVRVSATGGADLSLGTVTCEMAAALALWVEHDVQRLALEHLGSPVARIEHMGGYACRNIIGSKMWSGFRSQHARANAIDISGFRLKDGRTIRVLRQWAGDTDESRFLRAAHRAACRYFRVALGPDFNEAHRDHFHFDRGPFKSCK